MSPFADEEPLPIRRRRRWLRALPILVLVIAVGAQAILMATTSADRQSGSGFAMFSDVDFAGSRVALVSAETASGDALQVQLPPSAGDDLDRLLAAPSDDRAREFAAGLAVLDWTIAGGIAEPGGDRSLHSIAVVVRGLEADGRTLRAEVLATGVAP